MSSLRAFDRVGAALQTCDEPALYERSQSPVVLRDFACVDPSTNADFVRRPAKDNEQPGVLWPADRPITTARTRQTFALDFDQARISWYGRSQCVTDTRNPSLERLFVSSLLHRMRTVREYVSSPNIKRKDGHLSAPGDSHLRLPILGRPCASTRGLWLFRLCGVRGLSQSKGAALSFCHGSQGLWSVYYLTHYSGPHGRESTVYRIDSRSHLVGSLTDASLRRAIAAKYRSNGQKGPSCTPICRTGTKSYTN